MNQVTERIISFNEGRVPAMLNLKHEFMVENAFRFYRGTCHLFYEDLSKATGFPDAPPAWICGDLHFENFGIYRGANRLVYFDLNDFDESILAPATWEIVRLITSIYVGFESLEIEEKRAQKMAELCIASYAATLAKGKAYYIEHKTAKGIVCDFLKKASGKTEKRLMEKRTIEKSHRMLIERDDPRHDELEPFLKRELAHHLTNWIIHEPEGPYNYEVEDVAFRIAGTGSVGQKRYMFLLRSLLEKDKYLLVDMKQATASSLAPFVKLPQPAWENEAQRIISVQERMQNIPPALLSTTVFQDEAYILQELQPVKDSIDFNIIKDRYRDVYQVIDDLGTLTASAQLRSTGRQGSAITDELMAFGGRDDWRQPVLDYAKEYAKKVAADYKAYRKDYKDGKLEPAKEKVA